MAYSAAPTGAWRTGTLREIDHPADHLVRLRFEIPDRIDHLPGQHYVIRLTAPDGYVAQRSYSIASDPADPLLELMVECLKDGEVSSFLKEVAEVGDAFELRGPIGGWFVWDGSPPAVCIAGGPGVVPIVSMLRYARRMGAEDSLRVIAVARDLESLPYAAELEAAGAFIALTRDNHGDRVAAPPYPEEVAEVIASLRTSTPPRAYVCGSVGFASFANRLLVGAGIPTEEIRVEQFGPSA
ncbi:ferredoxin reductase [soil metagenome]